LTRSKREHLTLTSLIGIVGICLSAAAWASSNQEDCQTDLAFMPSFLSNNDTGAPAHLTQQGQAALTQALEQAQRKIDHVISEADCLMVLNQYLNSWRHGHLYAAPLSPTDQHASAQTKKADDQPHLRWMSRHTLLLTLPSFMPDQKAPLQQLLKRHRLKMARTPNWMLDLRTNVGGSDTTWQDLLTAIAINPIRAFSAEHLATAANIDSNLRICDLIASGNTDCISFVEQTVNRLRQAPTGTYVSTLPLNAPNPLMVYPQRSVSRAPNRVAVLIDRQCGSSCEEFVLAARQSYNVKLFGRRTNGSLDYSNLRPHPLPSQKRWVFYATSRSTRLPHLSVDVAGIAPDVLMLPPKDAADYDAEVKSVQQLLESFKH